MTEEPPKTLAGSSKARFSDRGSRFYGLAFPVMDLQDIENLLAETCGNYPDATHHCYAWRYNPFEPVEFTQDDGEPAGTAGLPILGTIKSAGLVNVLVIVARYYGGTKLGKTGLIHAYRETAALALANAGTVRLYRYIPFSIQYPYERESTIRELVNRFRMDTDHETYTEHITMTLYCPDRYEVELIGILDQLAHLGISSQNGPPLYRPAGSVKSG